MGTRVKEMMGRKSGLFVIVALLVFLVAGPECHGALAGQAGVSRARYTARLSSNKVLRKQQLIVDPVGILSGSASVAYDTSVVRLVEVLDPAEFEITSGLVGIVPRVGGLSIDLVPLDTFFGTASLTPAAAAPLAGGTFREQGFVQIFFDRRDTSSALRASPLASPDDSSVIPNLPGYTTVAEDGETGINDTHTLVFEYLPGVPNNIRAAYTVYATPPRALTVSDQIIPESDPENPIPYTELGTAQLFGTLEYDEPRPGHPVPLPAAGAAGAILIASMAVRRVVNSRSTNE